VALVDEILRDARQARDRLIAAQHEVDAARADYHHAIRRLCAAGGSMREIAEALGLSHQRVHQIVDEAPPLAVGRRRLFGGGPARFTRDARAVARAAQAEARALGHEQVAAGHVLLGLLAVGGAGGRALQALGVAPDSVRERLGRGPGAPRGHLPFAREAKQLLERALREALTLKHRYIGTEHVLLALADLDVLQELGVDGDQIRAEIHRQLAA
jgi:ATP-dependent Clp protease ATP-binding subunit ClpA